MRRINRAIAVAAVLTVSAVAVWAQDQCTDELKTAKYQEWYDNRKDHQDVAYKAANDFLTACPNEPADGPWAPQLKALKKFKADYEALNSNKELADKFQAAVTAKNYADQIRLGKQLAAMPNNADNAVIYIIMASAGLGDPNQLAESAQAAKKAIELIEGGKPFTPAYQTKDQALAAMNYVIAKSMMKTPTEAIPFFVKALRYESDLKKSPVAYNELATAYGEGPVEKFAGDYKNAAAAGKTVDSPEVKLIIANLNQAFDGQIDAFARAAAVATAADKTAIMKVLADVYKDRNHADATPEQLNTLVASALSKPVPDAPKPITELPAGSSTPGGSSATPTNGSGNGSTTSGSSNAGAAKPTATAPTSGNTKPAASGSTPAKPTPTPRPRQRANHRG